MPTTLSGWSELFALAAADPQGTINGGGAFTFTGGSLNVTCTSGCSGGSGGGGTSSTFGAAFPATGTATGFIDASGNMAGGTLDAGGRLIVTGAGGTFPVTGTFWQATQPVSIAATVTIAGTKTNNNAAPGATNVGALGCLANASAPSWTEGDQVLCSTDLAGNQRVILTAGAAVIGHVITDATSVTAATLSAETTKVIGTVRNVGNVGGVLDAIGQNVTAPANWWQVGCQFNTSPTTITSGNGSPTQCDNAGDALVKVNVALPTGTNVIGHVINDASSAVIGHVIADTGSTTAVTGNVTVVQPTGTNLHAVLDTTSTTAVTQATAANLNATVVGAGSAGTANAGVVTVQGIASMTKLLVTPDSVALPANQSVNVAQVNGVTTLTGAGAVGTGSQRVAVGQDTTTIAGSAPGTAGSASANVVTVQGVASMTKLLVTPDSVALPANQSVNVAQVGATAVVADPCQTVAKVYTPISVTAGATLVTGTSAKKNYICHIDIVTATAQNIGIIAGTGTVCATGSHQIFGGTTAATGWNFAANGGISMGDGGYAIGVTATNADNVCIVTSSSGQISGVLVTALQ